MARKIKRPNQVLFVLGIIMIILGSILLIISFMGVQQSALKIGTDFGSIEAEGISSTSIVFIISGIILIVFGIGIVTLAFKFGR